MTKMTIEIPNEEYKKLKIDAINLGLSIKDYVLSKLGIQKKILIRDDGVVRVLNRKTIAILEDSKKNPHKMLKFKNSGEAITYLENRSKKHK